VRWFDPDHDALWRAVLAVLAAPADDAPKLVLADWLQEFRPGSPTEAGLRWCVENGKWPVDLFASRYFIHNGIFPVPEMPRRNAWGFFYNNLPHHIGWSLRHLSSSGRGFRPLVGTWYLGFARTPQRCVRRVGHILMAGEGPWTTSVPA
jgi:uncharacterized protein (TIGR02996 family)